MANIVKLIIAGKSYKIKDSKAPWGLMLDPMQNKDGALVYYNNIGTFLCRTLDLYFLDKNFIVISKQSACHFLHPRSWLGYRNARAKYCLEVKKGISDIKIGTKIRLSEKN